MVDGTSTTLFGGRCHTDHVLYRERAIAERRRDRLLLEAGFEVVHVTWQELFSDAARVAGRIREAFRRAQRLGLAR